MESLFTSRKPKKGMVSLMLAGSLVLHGGLVGVASLWTPQPKQEKVVIDLFPVEGDPIAIDRKDLPTVPVETPVTTATPEAIDPVATPPPPSEDVEFALPPEATPLPRRIATVRPPVSVNRPTGVPSGPRTAGPSGSGTPGLGNPSGTGTWITPHPPYPARAMGRMAGIGQTTVRITTDASGRVSNATIVRSTGNPILDNHTLSYVRNNWHGPPNASRTTEFVYELR